jgi:DNA-binding SARP family transcriptional activator
MFIKRRFYHEAISNNPEESNKKVETDERSDRCISHGCSMFMKRPFNGEAIWWSREQGIKEDSRKR